MRFQRIFIEQSDLGSLPLCNKMKVCTTTHQGPYTQVNETSDLGKGASRQ